jgi:hypothetical protein
MEPAAAWSWLCTNYATQQFVEVLEDLKILTSFKIDLSDPNPQLAKYCFHYTHIPIIPEVPVSTTNTVIVPATPFISQSMASLILLSTLPLSSDPSQDSVYQCTLEDYTTSFAVPNMTLDNLMDTIHTTWASCFGHLTEVQKPKRGTFYIPKGIKVLPQKSHK